MKTRFLPILSVCIASVLAAGVSHAAVLVGYNFTGGTSGTLTPTSAFAPTTPPPTNVTATSISLAAGVSGSTFQTNGGNIELNLSPGTTAAAESTAISSNQYLEFTLNTPSASFGLDLDTLTLDLREGGTSGTRNIFLRTSLDSYATSISPGVVAATATTAPVTFTTPNTALYNSVPGAVTFRLYTYSGTAGRSVRVDNIVVNGAVIPEPTTFAMLLGGFGMLTMLRRRRR